MIKFIIKLFIFSLILGSISILLAFIDYKYPELTAYQIIHDQFISKIDSVESLAVGHSHNMSLKFSVLGEKGYHLWFSGSDVFETLYILKIIAPRMPNLKKIYLPIALSALIWDNGLRNENGKSKRRKIYQLFPSLSLIDNDFQNYIMAIMYRLARDDYWEKIIMSVFTLSNQVDRKIYDNFYIAADGAHINPRYSNILNLQELKDKAKENSDNKNHIKDDDEIAQNLEIESRVKATLLQIRDYLNSAGITVIFYTTPHYIDYVNEVDQTMANDMRKFMSDLAKDNPSNYYDFSRDSLFTYDHKLFYGYTHMNGEGAEKFSLYFADIMRRSEIE